MLMWIDNLLVRSSQTVVRTWLLVALLGFGLTAVSYYVANVGVLTFQGRLADGRMVNHYATAKQIGYFAALNWALFGAILLPTIVAFSVKLRGEMEPALRALARRSMARATDGSFAVLTETQLLERWRRDRASGLFIPFCAALLSVLFVVLGWWTSVGGPILRGIGPRLLDINAGSLEYDWSIACLLQTDQDVKCGPNLAFGIAAFLVVPCVVSAVAFWSMIDAALFVAFACGETSSAEAADDHGSPLPTDWTLVASAADPDDSRCGFEAFEGFFSALLFNAFFILLSLFLMITQNSFLRDPASANILEFFAQDFAGVTNAVASLNPAHFDLVAFAGALIHSDKAINLFNPKTIFGILSFFFVVFLCLAATMVLLRKAAGAACQLAEDNRAVLADELGISQTEVCERLKQMRFWPIGWMSQNTTIVVIIFMSFSLFSFRLAVLPIAVGLVWVIAAFLSFIRSILSPATANRGAAQRRRIDRRALRRPAPPEAKPGGS